MTWLHRVTVNQVLMHFRRKAARPKEVSCDTETAVEIEALSAVKNVAGAPARVELEKAIAELPPGYRLVLVMHDVEGYEHGEIARAAGISVGTSKSQLHKARRKLRRLLLGRSGE
jgi:RNA polymerase sigma-70 factor (ECF subfamily)